MIWSEEINIYIYICQWQVFLYCFPSLCIYVGMANTAEWR